MTKLLRRVLAWTESVPEIVPITMSLAAITLLTAGVLEALLASLTLTTVALSLDTWCTTRSPMPEPPSCGPSKTPSLPVAPPSNRLAPSRWR
ncbi:MAG: hypothetical protein ACON5B_02240 [Myxococcota bacterium]